MSPSLAVVIAHECAPPAAMPVALSCLVVATRVARSTVEPSPSWPGWFAPQHQIPGVPVAGDLGRDGAGVRAAGADRGRGRESGTRTGVGCTMSPPMPS